VLPCVVSVESLFFLFDEHANSMGTTRSSARIEVKIFLFIVAFLSAKIFEIAFIVVYHRVHIKSTTQKKRVYAFQAPNISIISQ